MTPSEGDRLWRQARVRHLGEQYRASTRLRLPAVEPAYKIAGDSFDYALNDDISHAVVIDAMGHGLDAATMATVAIGAYRHARRADIGLAEMYAFMDRAVAEQFGPDHFVTAQMMDLDVTTGHLQWVDAVHPAPLLIRSHQVAGPLEGPTTLPIGLGGEPPAVSEHQLQRGDRVLCYTDGVIEERDAKGELFGEERLISCVPLSPVPHCSHTASVSSPGRFTPCMQFSSAEIASDRSCIISAGRAGFAWLDEQLRRGGPAK